MAVSKVERLMNLVIALLSSRGYLTAERIHRSVAGYADCPTEEAFSRMFERDKAELRDLGIPVETGKASGFDATEGYRISSAVYALPDIDLTGEERAAVAVATTLWESPERITATQRALLKLRAAGVDIDPVAEVAITTGAGPTGLRGAEGVLGTLFTAIEAGQAVEFQHRPTPLESFTVRTVEPWGVVTSHGRWYLVGHDRDRNDTRIFRLSRIGPDPSPIGPTGAVKRPEGVDLRALVERSIGQATAGGAAGGTARVWVADGHAVSLRRVGRPAGRRSIGGPDGSREGDVIEIDANAPEWLAREIAGHGADALVLEPASLRDDVVARLTAQAQVGASA